ncbi:bactofilin family protein [Paenibacillus harenae]|uniref:bactofilin family protein n=1 Tax=Paenibacillus harenae TaxID=306543 RepID=UPI000416ECA6|nr:polymer-forming cytoskeletal protein [Paenibacillus harenae]
MFKRKTTAINPDTTDTLIGEGTIFEGRIKSEASIRIEGQIIGDIESGGDVIIGENGSAQSNIASRDLILAGRLTGNAEIQGKLTIRPTGILIGNLSAQSLIIESGGVFQGNSHMAVKEQAAASAKAPAAEAAEESAAVSAVTDSSSLKAW